MIAALECVSFVTCFEEDTPLDLILRLKPDHLVKGGDWKPEDIVGAREVRDSGGTVHSIPFQYERSTSDLVDRIRSS